MVAPRNPAGVGAAVVGCDPAVEVVACADVAGGVGPVAMVVSPADPVGDGTVVVYPVVAAGRVVGVAAWVAPPPHAATVASAASRAGRRRVRTGGVAQRYDLRPPDEWDPTARPGAAA
jgi:hypothetical protein